MRALIILGLITGAFLMWRSSLPPLLEQNVPLDLTIQHHLEHCPRSTSVPHERFGSEMMNAFLDRYSLPTVDYRREESELDEIIRFQFSWSERNRRVDMRVTHESPLGGSKTHIYVLTYEEDEWVISESSHLGPTLDEFGCVF
jgi:hypothetical protein